MLITPGSWRVNFYRLTLTTLKFVKYTVTLYLRYLPELQMGNRLGNRLVLDDRLGNRLVGRHRLTSLHCEPSLQFHDLPSRDIARWLGDGTASPPEHKRQVPQETAKLSLPSCWRVKSVLWKHDVKSKTRACLYRPQVTPRVRVARAAFIYGDKSFLGMFKQLFDHLTCLPLIWGATKNKLDRFEIKKKSCYHLDLNLLFGSRICLI